MIEVTSKRLVAHVGDQLVITDIEITQTTVPVQVEFDDILAAVEVNDGIIYLDFEGYDSDAYFDGEDDIPDASRQLAQVVADMMEVDGVRVVGRPK